LELLQKIVSKNPCPHTTESLKIVSKYPCPHEWFLKNLNLKFLKISILDVKTCVNVSAWVQFVKGSILVNTVCESDVSEEL
jgi:hypothetical protein